MGYTKVITYSETVETYEYETHPGSTGQKARTNKNDNGVSSISDDRQDIKQPEEQEKTRSKESIKRAIMGFKRLVRANISVFERPLLITLTYAENQADISISRKDFNAFARNLRFAFGQKVRYITVAEYQRRGAVHFHTLVWGLPNGMAAIERSTRLVATLWQHGFVDVIETDGSPKLANYLAKYFGKQLIDPRFFGRKAYIASRNVERPVVDKNTVVFPYLISPNRLLYEVEYMTPYMGKGRYRMYRLLTQYLVNASTSNI